MRRPLAIAIVLGVAAASALAVGTGSVIATPPATITLTAGSGGSGSAALMNTTSSSIDVTLVPDVSCDPDVGLAVAGGNTFALAANGMQAIGLPCGASQPPGMERCLVHATEATSGNPLADLLGVCELATTPSLVPSTTTVAFGTVAIGDTATLPVVLTNTSATTITTLFLQTDDLADDFQLSAPCNPDAPSCNGPVPALAPNGSATVFVTCAPRSTGPLSAQLEVATDTSQHLSQRIALSCTGAPAAAPVLGISPATIVVREPVEVLSAQAQTTVRLENLGTGTLQLTDVRVVDVVIGAAADWTFAVSGACSVLPCSLAAGAEVALAVTFDPSVIARRDASLLISFHDTIDRTHSIPLAGTGQGATLAGLPPTALDFGAVPVGHTSSLAVPLVNRGNRDTMATLSTTPTGPIGTLDGTVTVSPTAMTTVTAICAPTVAGSAAATIAAQSPDSADVDVTATCTGITTPLFASPTAVTLGEVRVGTAPQTIAIALQSTGAPLVFSGAPAFDAPNPNLAVGSLSAATTPATVDVTLTPTATGVFTARLVVADTAGDTLRIPITATIVTASYTAPAAFDIGTFCVGQPTATANVALQNDGTATLEVAAPALPAASPFQLGFTVPTVYPASLAANDSEIVAVTPERQSTAATLADALTWTTDSGAMPIATTAITATFVDNGGAIAPPNLDFGKVPVHVFVDDGQRVMIQNCNSTTLELDPPTIKAPFSIDSPSFPTTLAPSETATFSIGFHPTNLGLFQQTFAITSPQLPSQPLQVMLVGDSVSTTPPSMDAGTGSGAPAATSFYACSCARDPRGAWPILLALGVLIARRRSGSS